MPWKPLCLSLLALLLSAGCVTPLGKTKTASHHSDSEDEEEDEDATPETIRRHTAKPTYEPDPWNINKWLKDERTAEIERNLGVH